jgi:hypothetical protein
MQSNQLARSPGLLPFTHRAGHGRPGTTKVWSTCTSFLGLDIMTSDGEAAPRFTPRVSLP